MTDKLLPTIHSAREPITAEFLERTFNQYYTGLHRYAYSILEDADQAKDIVQQVFVSLWEKKDKININISVKSYLYRAVYNGCINQQTRENKHQSLEAENPVQSFIRPEFQAEIRELKAILDQAVAGMPAQCGEVFRKSRQEGKTYPVIAKELGISVKTVEAHISKALKTVREALKKYDMLSVLSIIFSWTLKK